MIPSTRLGRLDCIHGHRTNTISDMIMDSRVVIIWPKYCCVILTLSSLLLLSTLLLLIEGGGGWPTPTSASWKPFSFTTMPSLSSGAKLVVVVSLFSSSTRWCHRDETIGSYGLDSARSVIRNKRKVPINAQPVQTWTCALWWALCIFYICFSLHPQLSLFLPVLQFDLDLLHHRGVRKGKKLETSPNEFY